MNNKKEYDFLRELTAVDDEKISEIASKYPMPDKSALQRINALCEEKLAMKENVLNIPKELENVEVIRSIPWYRRPAFTAAACFAVLVGITGGIMAVFSGKSDKDNIPDNPPLTIVEATTTETTETTDITESSETTVQTVTTAIQTVTETATKTSEQNNEDMEMPDLVGKSYSSSKGEYKDYFVLIADESIYNDEYEEGIIIEQNIVAGTHITKGSTVKVKVSKGSQPENEEPPVNLPDDETIDELIDALELIEAFMSNGVELDCDMDDKFTNENGQLYVKVTESGFYTISDVENYMNNYLTEEFINSRFKALTDRNSGKFIEKENGLYIRCTPIANSFYGISEQKPLIIVRKTDDGTERVEALVNYDNFGEPATLALHLIEVSEGSWKINGIATN